jgi:methylisocitrate lyase
MLHKPMASPGGALRSLFSSDTVLMPGVFNGISAVVASKAGARALYLSGAGMTNACLGVPDIALATLSEFASQAASVTAVTQIPVISDADTGFGETWNVYRTVLEMERAGLAGIHIEDQIMPKRCGHLDGKGLVPAEEMAAKIAAAGNAKRDPDFLIVARTDARGVEGFDSAVERARRYVDAGCDAVFPEGLESVEEFERFRARIPVPLLANMTEFGKTPLISVQQFKSLGYQMVIFPMTAFRTMLKTLDRTYRELLESGTQAGLLGEMKTREELYQLIDYPEYIAQDASLGSNRAMPRSGFSGS